MPRRVVITGLGLITPLGMDRQSFRAALRAGRSAVRRLQAIVSSELPVAIGAEIEGFDAKTFLEKKDRKRLNAMPRTMRLAVAASAQAAGEARLRESPPDPARFGTVFGSGVIPASEDLGPAALAVAGERRGPIDLAAWGERGLPNVPPMWMLNCIPNVMTGHVSILHGAQGPNNTITLSEAAGLAALSEGFRVVAGGRAEVMMAGAADSYVLPFNFGRHCLFSPLARGGDDPTRACRPFDRRSLGSVAGEGGVAMVLEEEAHARERGVTIFAEILGTGAAFDRRRDGSGLARAIRAALAQARMSASDIGHVNAHGLGTRESDRLEARALHAVFGAAIPPVLAMKSRFGNLGAGSSLAELAASLLALEDDELPPTLNYGQGDEEYPLPVLTTARRIENPNVLKVSFTGLGQCFAVVLRSP